MKQLLALVLLTACVSAQAWAFSGTVSWVHDGDTLTVDGKRVRLFGIDAPELSQPGGKASREFLASLALGGEVRVEERDVDEYGRVVGLVLLPGGREAGTEMIKAGHAWVYRKYCRGCYGLELAQTLARLRGLGLWSEPGQVPPWTWRKMHRSAR